MDNFRRPRRPRRGAAIDGFIGSRHTPTTGSIGTGSRHGSTPRTSAQQTLGNFRQPEGFRPAAAPTMASSTASSTTMLSKSLPLPPPSPSVARGKKRAKARGAKVKTSRNWRKILKRTSLAMAALVLFGGGFMVFNLYIKSGKVLKGGGGAAALQKNVDPALLKGEGDGRVNIMVLGKGGAGHEAPDLTDTLMIASIDPVGKEAALLSVPRDLWVKTQNTGSMKINAVYANEKNKVLARRKYSGQQADAEKAGLSAIEQTLEASLGIPIHYYTLVDFEAFRKAIDTVGGVDVVAKERLYDPTIAWENGRNPLIASVGPNHFNGKRALLYARSRYTSARGDFDRAQRQREIIIALKDKVLTLGTFGNPVKITELINAFGDHVQTSFTRDELMRLYDLAKQIPSSKINSVSLVDPPNVLLASGNIGGQSVVLPRAGAGNFEEIQSFVRNALKDSYLKSENAAIAVLNGTETAGLATKKGDELKSYAYNVVQVADSPVKGNAQTLLVDMRNGAKKYTRNYLEKRLGVKATTSLPTGVDPGAADFVIIIGQSEANISR